MRAAVCIQVTGFTPTFFIIIIFLCFVLASTNLENNTLLIPTYKAYSSNEVDGVSLYDVNKTCPLFVISRLGLKGFGDRLEHLIYYMNIARRLQATLIIESSSKDIFSYWQQQDPPHDGASEYLTIMAEFLGVNFSSNLSIIPSLLPSRRINYDDLHRLVTKPNTVKCHTVFESSIESCGPGSHLWCFRYHALTDVVRSIMSTNGSTSGNRVPARKCHEKKKGFSAESKTINIAMHIRNGDICVNFCDEIWHFRMLLDSVLKPLGLHQQDPALYRKVSIYVDSNLKLVEHKKKFPLIQFMSRESEGNSFEHMICRFVTADIYVGSGSSILAMAAFLPVNHPVIFEQTRKTPKKKTDMAMKYLFPVNESIRTKSGKLVTPLSEAIDVLKMSLGSKYPRHNDSPNLTVANASLISSNS